MDSDTLAVAAKNRLKIKISSKDSSEETLAENVHNGLTKNPKTLSSKFFYDMIGSELFEQITELPEYYLTRSETEILERFSDEIAATAENCTELIELGSGSSIKTQLLIKAFLKKNKRLQYIPIDISKNMVIKSAKRLLRSFENLRIITLVSDYANALDALKKRKSAPKMILFLGSSIGNFSESNADRFLGKVRRALQRGDKFLIGMDLVKSPERLIRAYDDSQGVTAQFNLNLLTRINRELGGQFDTTHFRHQATYNEEKNRIESYLVSQKKQRVYVEQLNEYFDFEAGESIHTENSHKYTEATIADMAARSDFHIKQMWFDKAGWFSLVMMEPA